MNRKPPVPGDGLSRFLGGLALAFLALGLGLGIYSGVCHLRTTVSCEKALADGGAEELFRCVHRLRSPHLFSGVEPFTGYGPPREQEKAARAYAMLATGSDYDPKALAFLIHNPAHYLAAFQEHRDTGQVVSGDYTVVRHVLARHANGVHSGVVFSLHAGLCFVILGLVWMSWFRWGLARRMPQPPPAPPGGVQPGPEAKETTSRKGS